MNLPYHFPNQFLTPDEYLFAKELCCWSHIRYASSLALTLLFCLVSKCTEFKIPYNRMYYFLSLEDIGYTSLKIHFPGNSQSISIKHMYSCQALATEIIFQSLVLLSAKIFFWGGGGSDVLQNKATTESHMVFYPWRKHQSNAQYTRPLLDW